VDDPEHVRIMEHPRGRRGLGHLPPQHHLPLPEPLQTRQRQDGDDRQEQELGTQEGQELAPEIKVAEAAQGLHGRSSDDE